MLELRAHFGISATEALTEIPSWEYDLLVASLSADEDDAGPGGDAGAVVSEDLLEPPVPEALKGM